MYYRPEESAAADVIPFYKDGAFQLFYLRDFRRADAGKVPRGICWKPGILLLLQKRGRLFPEEAGRSRIFIFLPEASLREMAAITYFIPAIILISRKKGRNRKSSGWR